MYSISETARPLTVADLRRLRADVRVRGRDPGPYELALTPAQYNDLRHDMARRPQEYYEMTPPNAQGDGSIYGFRLTVLRPLDPDRRALRPLVEDDPLWPAEWPTRRDAVAAPQGFYDDLRSWRVPIAESVDWGMGRWIEPPTPPTPPTPAPRTSHTGWPVR